MFLWCSPLVIVLEVAAAAPTDTMTAELQGLECINATSTSLNLRWPKQDATDLYLVTVAPAADSRPVALQTTLGTQLMFDDLYPNRDYWLQLRSHPSSEPTPEVWGWRNPAASVRCHTTPENTLAPHGLRRRGARPYTNEIHVEFTPATRGVSVTGGAATARSHSIGVRVVGATHWVWSPAADLNGGTLRALPSATTFDVVVRDEVTGSVSDPLVMRTAAPNSRYTDAWRISEYTFDVDFLQNHDAGDNQTLPLYVQYSGAINESCYSGFAAGADKCNSLGGACIDKLSSLCAAERGNGFSCMKCADRHRSQLLDTCGNFSNADDVQDSGRWGEHWFCGAGWPGSTFQRSPMTSYCVEHAMAPQTDPSPPGLGYSQYISCNSDECEVTNNSTPREPICICWVHDDRENSQQPESEIAKVCNPKGDPSGFLPCRGVDEQFCKRAPQCNCTIGAPGTEATAIPPSSAMATHVGRSNVWLPWSYDDSRILVGGFLSFPKAGACQEGQDLFQQDCKWKRLPRSRMLYGADLLAAGFNVSQAFQQMKPVDEIAFGLRNIAAFQRAQQELDKVVQPRCCGC